MSYNNRPRPNVSQYIANLNIIPSQHEHPPAPETFSTEDELALFVNSEFFDFDTSGINNMDPSIDFDAAADARSRQQHASAFKADGYNAGGEFHYPDYASYQNIPHNAPAYSPSAPPSATTQQVPFPLATQLSSPTSSASPTATSANDARSDKRKLDQLSLDPLGQGPIDDQSRHAAEEDKRRRNTAASARFRVKKKQREQALEKTAKEMTEKVERLESRIQQLELENKWLKGLITEKNEGKGAEAIAKLSKEAEKA